MGKRGPGPGPKIRCKLCGDVIQSMHRHDFKWCECQQVAVDGGGWYTKILFNDPGDYEPVEET